MPKPVDVTTPSDREVTVTRVFDAPAQMVWAAHTRPELIQRWLVGSEDWFMPYCKVDLRVGGRYRYIWQNKHTGGRFGSYGEHQEITPVERLVTSEQMDGLSLDEQINDEPAWGEGEPAINTLTLSEAGAKTTLSLIMRYPSKDLRDMALQSGMSDGMAMGYDLLDDFLAAQTDR
ncbi:SRPBCC domain-containing protein [Phenylobacterium sp.]|jgi:uncharacterized protein YndB with AHSA1/START domain|uniref:SRPBCC domain-containing protein n=1 Tax=Phenylobacterium sp. TaxID=1871053 RepID=UPI0037C6EA68